MDDWKASVFSAGIGIATSAITNWSGERLGHKTTTVISLCGVAFLCAGVSMTPAWIPWIFMALGIAAIATSEVAKNRQRKRAESALVPFATGSAVAISCHWPMAQIFDSKTDKGISVVLDLRNWSPFDVLLELQNLRIWVSDVARWDTLVCAAMCERLTLQGGGGSAEQSIVVPLSQEQVARLRNTVSRVRSTFVPVRFIFDLQVWKVGETFGAPLDRRSCDVRTFLYVNDN